MNTDAIVYRMQHGEKLEDLLDPVVEPRCKNCRFWRKWDNGDDADCTKFYPMDSDGDWEAADYETGNMARASYSDSTIHTGPEFGCIHFEAK